MASDDSDSDAKIRIGQDGSSEDGQENAPPNENMMNEIGVDEFDGLEEAA